MTWCLVRIWGIYPPSGPNITPLSESFVECQDQKRDWWVSVYHGCCYLVQISFPLTLHPSHKTAQTATADHIQPMRWHPFAALDLQDRVQFPQPFTIWTQPFFISHSFPIPCPSQTELLAVSRYILSVHSNCPQETHFSFACSVVHSQLPPKPLFPIRSKLFEL